MIFHPGEIPDPQKRPFQRIPSPNEDRLQVSDIEGPLLTTALGKKRINKNPSGGLS
jgi:hypothetical protein